MRPVAVALSAIALASFARAASAQAPPPAPPVVAQPAPPGLTPMPPPVGPNGAGLPPPSYPPNAGYPQSAGYPPNAGYAPNGYPPPQLYPPMPPWWLYQEKLPYFAGVEPPPGFHVESESNRGLVVTGTVLFLSGYVASFIGASSVIAGGDRHGEGYGPLYVPIVGPFITLGTGRDTQFSRSGSGGLAMVLDGLAQTTGAALLFIGIAAKHKVFVRGAGPDQARAVLQLPEVRVGAGTTSFRWRF